MIGTRGYSFHLERNSVYLNERERDGESQTEREHGKRYPLKFFHPAVNKENREPADADPEKRDRYDKKSEMIPVCQRKQPVDYDLKGQDHH